MQAKVAASETARIDNLASMGFSFVEGEIDFALTVGTENAYLNTALSETDNVVVAQTGDIVFCATPRQLCLVTAAFVRLGIEKGIAVGFMHYG